MYTIFDTETSNFFNADLAPNDPNQGRIIQLGCLLLDEQFNECGVFCSYIKPGGWIISEGAKSAHGIDIETCEKYGVDINLPFSVLHSFFCQSKLIVGHNISFDIKMLKNEIAWLQLANVYELTKPREICTMNAMTPICKLRGKYSGKFKWPKLSEAYEFLFNEKFDKAHDALADVRATARILKWLVTNGKVVLNEPAVTVS